MFSHIISSLSFKMIYIVYLDQKRGTRAHWARSKPPTGHYLGATYKFMWQPPHNQLMWTPPNKFIWRPPHYDLFHFLFSLWHKSTSVFNTTSWRYCNSSWVWSRCCRGGTGFVDRNRSRYRYYRFILFKDRFFLKLKKFLWRHLLSMDRWTNQPVEVDS